jgi:hypothetical protein
LIPRVEELVLAEVPRDDLKDFLRTLGRVVGDHRTPRTTEQVPEL